MASTASQQKYLKERLSEIKNSKPSRYSEMDFPETAEVKVARKQLETAKKVIEHHDKKKGEAVAARAASIRIAYNECMRAIMFGTPQEALKTIDKFEADKF